MSENSEDDFGVMREFAKQVSEGFTHMNSVPVSGTYLVTHSDGTTEPRDLEANRPFPAGTDGDQPLYSAIKIDVPPTEVNLLDGFKS